MEEGRYVLKLRWGIFVRNLESGFNDRDVIFSRIGLNLRDTYHLWEGMKMRSGRKWISTVFALLLVFFTIPHAYMEGTVPSLGISSPLIDVDDHWAQNSIETWRGYGVMTGYPDGSFQPDKAITRGEFVKVINMIFGLTAKSDRQFSDVSPNAWYADQLSIAREAGYYIGFPNNRAKAESEITREDAVTLAARIFHLEPTEGSTFADRFKDADQISGYAKDAINALSGMINGYGDGTLRPKEPMTRGEFAALLDRLLSGYYSQAGEHSGSTFSGNVLVNSDGVAMRDTAIAGNLYLAPGIGDGEITLENVNVNGRLFVSGGGEHSIILKNSNVKSIIINRPDGRVRVVTGGNTQIGDIVMNSDSRLELNDQTRVTSIAANKPVALTIAEGVEVLRFTANRSAQGSTVSGKGTIRLAVIQADHVTLNGIGMEKGSFAIREGEAIPTSGNYSNIPNGDDISGGGSIGKRRVEDLVDPQATDETRSLFAYLKDIRGEQVLFGHQHSTDVGMTLTGSVQPESDVKNAVGDFPAVFGWDTLSLEGKEKPGVPGDIEQSRANLVASVKAIHKLGGIFTFSTHMPNFVTGGSFNDTTGAVVENILPGGEYNDEFNAFLDNIALFAKELQDDEGRPIPVLFRPFHEQNGGWFWWGAKTTTPSQYIELYRYTVEYLRDRKGVHNFLYVYSPNGPFGGDETNYLATYPGDDYVDILGMDQYDNQSNPGTEQFLNNLVSDLAMISKLADAKGKIATLSEFGYSPQGMKTTGNGDLHWFTRLLNAIKGDPDAKRIAYMLTWANFNLNGNLFVPYKGAPELGDHELLPDFIEYYKDPYTGFLHEVSGVYTKKVDTVEKKPFMHIASPTDDATVKTTTTKIRARVLNFTPSKVVYEADGTDGEVTMRLDEDGYYTADWSPAAQLNGKTAKITVKTYSGDKILFEQTVTVFIKVPEILLKEYPFDGDINGILNNGTYPSSMKMNLAYAMLSGDGKLKITVTGMVYSDTWQELKLELAGIQDLVPLTDVKRVKFEVLVPVSAGAQNSNASLRGIVMLPPDWDTKYGMTTTEKKMSELEKVTIDGIEYAKYPVSIDLNDPDKLKTATGLALSVVGNGLGFEGEGVIYVDNIQLLNTYVEAPADPALVDDFESYQGSDTSLRTKFVKAGGDDISVSLDGSHQSGGMYAMRVDYRLAGSGYAGVTKSLGGVDWSGYNKLKFWLVPDGSKQKLVIQLKINGIYFEAYPSLASTTPGWVEIHFNQFSVAPWDTANQGKQIDKESLKKVQEFSIYINSVDGTTKSNTLYFDDIKALNDGTGGVPNGGTGPGSTPAKPGTLYDFETGVEGWIVEVNQADATSPTVTSDAAAKGSYSLTSSFNVTKTAGFELTKVEAIDLSAVKSISAKVKLSAGKANARLYIKTGPNWEWHDSGFVIVDAGEFKTLTIQLDPAWGLDNVKSIGVKIEPTEGSGTVNVYVDDVSLSDA